MTRLPPPPASLIAGSALFLDFDGTLVELAASPDAIRVSEGLGPLLMRLCDRLGGRLAIVSGRGIDDLRRHLPAGDLILSGSHGLELQLADGSRLPLDLPPQLPSARERVRRFAGGRSGLLVEDKPTGIALHYRQAPEQAAAVMAFIEMVAREEQLQVQHGNMVAELRPSGATKGDAILGLMERAPFAGARPIFVGDDLTDEHGFEAVARLGGDGILVGPERETAAHYRLPGVAAVADWLESAA